MIFPKHEKAYISETDRFLVAFDRQWPDKSASQLAEIARDQEISRLRDHAATTNAVDIFDF